MAHGLSSKKRVRQNSVRRLRNRGRKQRLKTEERRFAEAEHDQDVERAKAELITLNKRLDQTAAKGTLHRNTAARKKSRLAKRLNKLVAGSGS